MQGGQRQPLLADQQDARGFTIQAMREFEEFCLWPLPAQCFDNPKTDAAAAMDRNALRLVDNQQGLVLEKDGQINPCLGCLLDFILRTLGDADRRDTQFVASQETVGGIDAFAVYPHLSATQDTVDMTLGNPLANPDQEVVQALPGFFFTDQAVGD